MHIPTFFARVAELSTDAQLLKMVEGLRVKVHDMWYTAANKDGKLVLINPHGEDCTFSDISSIQEIEWPKTEPVLNTKGAETGRTVEAGLSLSSQAMAAVGGKPKT